MEKIFIGTFILPLLLLLGCAHQNVNRDEIIADETDFVITQEDSCAGVADCVTEAESCSDDSDTACYGGIKQEYVVKGCKVTIYNNGPVRRANVKTSQPCNAPIPEDHDFGGTKRVYQENGCTITEYIHKNGIGEATMDCSK